MLVTVSNSTEGVNIKTRFSVRFTLNVPVGATKSIKNFKNKNINNNNNNNKKIDKNFVTKS